VDRRDVAGADGLDRLLEQLREHAAVAPGVAGDRLQARPGGVEHAADGGMLGAQLQRRRLQLRGAVGAHQRGLTLELRRTPRWARSCSASACAAATRAEACARASDTMASISALASRSSRADRSDTGFSQPGR
jgi:hypothetical protein